MLLIFFLLAVAAFTGLFLALQNQKHFQAQVLDEIQNLKDLLHSLKADVKGERTEVQLHLPPEPPVNEPEPDRPVVPKTEELHREETSPKSPYAEAIPPPLPTTLETDALSSSKSEPNSELDAELEVDKQPRPQSAFENAARQILLKIWNWVIVGEEYRPANVRMEYAIASNWLLRLGVIIFVTGIGFLVKYSIENNLMPPVARISLSILTGIAMITAGVKLYRSRYNLFAQGMLGGGLAILYFSVFASYNFYNLLNFYFAFLLMGIVTVAAGIIAIGFNSLLIAILGLIGGYFTPIILTSAQIDFVSLFGYVLVLGLGVFGIAYKKNWRLLNYLSLLFTYAIVTSALHQGYESALFWHVFPFICAFFILFSSMTFVHNLVRRTTSTLLEVIVLLLNAAVFFTIAYVLVTQAFSQEWAAVLTICLALFYTGHVYYALLTQRLDRGLLFSFMALAVFFLTVTMPLLLSEAWITVSWALQALVILWLAAKLQSKFLRHLAYVIYVIVLWRMLFIDMAAQYAVPMQPDATMAFNVYLLALLERLIIFGIPIASIAAGAYLLLRFERPAAIQTPESAENPECVQRNGMFITAVALAVVLLFTYLHLELNRTFLYLFSPMRLPVLTLLWTVLALVLLRTFSATRNRILFGLFAITTLVLLVKLFIIDLPALHIRLPDFYYNGSYSVLYGTMRLFDFGVIILFALYCMKSLRKQQQKSLSRIASIFSWMSIILLFIFSTIELNTVLHAFIPGLRAGGISILWSIFALALLVHGIRRNKTSVRYTGLALFALVVWKIFFIDLNQLGQLYRIIAFIVLGIIVLSASLLYLNYRKMFETQNEPSAGNERT